MAPTSIEELRVMERKLAAILVADVVGFSRQMGEDEISTLETLWAIRRDVVDPAIKTHHGRIVHPTGDGVLVEFSSVVDAVSCAVQVQTDMRRCNDEREYPKNLSLRIGINLGDVIVDHDDVHGDGVNIAVRVEGLADPGGICVTHPVYTEVRDKLPYEFKNLGEKSVKNIKRPQQVYRLMMNDKNGTAACELVKSLEAPQSDKPSIAVLPFTNLGGDPKREIFSDGITLDVITDLSKFSSLFVVAANSTFRYKGQAVKPQDVGRELGVRYMLEGSVQRDGRRLRVNAQLIDASSGRHVWAERWDRDTVDLFEVQSEIAREIVAVIGPISGAQGKLLASELKRLEHTATENLDAYGHFLQATLIRQSEAPDSNVNSRAAYDRAIALDPTYAKAIAHKAWTYVYEYWESRAEDPEKALETAEALALQAVTIDPAEPEAHKNLGAVKLFLHQHDLAVHSLRKAVELNPNGADMLMWLGWGLTYAGEPDEGLSVMEQAMARNPFPPEWYLWDLAWASFNIGRYEAAAKALEKTKPKAILSQLLLAASYAKIGRSDAAEAVMCRLREAEPNFTIETVGRVNPFKNPKDLQHYLDALRDAGLPESIRD